YCLSGHRSSPVPRILPSFSSPTIFVFTSTPTPQIYPLSLHDALPISGKLKPGDKLPAITKMADSYGVSQASIREALNRLKVLDVIQVKHGHGSFINHRMPLGFEQNFEIITKADIANLLDLRKIIGMEWTRSACEKADQNDVKKMEDALQKMWTAVENNELGEQADYAFHIAIAEATGNPLLINLMEDVSDTVIRTMKETRRIWLYETK